LAEHLGAILGAPVVQNALHDIDILALALLGLEEVLNFKLDTVSQVLGLDEVLGSLASLGEVLNDELFDVGVTII